MGQTLHYNELHGIRRTSGHPAHRASPQPKGH